MATTITLSDGTTTLNLMTPTDYRIAYGSVASPGAPATITWSGNRQQQGQTPAFRRWGNKEIRLVLRVEGTTQDDLLNNYNAAERLILGATRYWTSNGTTGAEVKLTVQLNGATNATEYNVYQGSVDPGSWATELTTTAFRLFCPVTLVCAPFGRETADATFGGASLYNSGISFNVTAARGVVETPTKIQLTTLNVLLGARVVVANRTRGNTSNFFYKVENEDTSAVTTAKYHVDAGNWTITAVTTTTGVASLGGYARIAATASASAETLLQSISITSNVADNLGSYRVFMRARPSTAGNNYPPTTAPFYFRYGESAVLTTADPETGVHTLTTTTGWSLNDLGIVTWPSRTVPPNRAPGSLRFDIRWGPFPTANSYSIDIDYLLFMPIDESFFMADIGNASYAQRFTVDGMGFPPTFYSQDTSGSPVPAGLTTAVFGTFPMMPPGNSRWFVYFNNATNDTVDDYMNVSGFFRPQYGFMRGTT